MKQFALLGLVGLMPLGVSAGGARCGSNSEAAWTGKLTAVNADNHTITAKSWWGKKTFNVGDTCAISTMDNKTAALNDLRPGEKVRVHYQKTGGVWIAEHIGVEPMHLTGTVHGVDQKNRTLTMEEPLKDRTFRLADDCKIVLWNDKDGSLADLTPGNRLLVTYELPGGSPTAYRIRERTQTYTGKVDAIDLTDHTVKAGELLGSKRFNLASDCRIVVNGKPNGHLSDLQLDRRYQFTYENVDGVNVVNRIAPTSEPTPATTASMR